MLNREKQLGYSLYLIDDHKVGGIIYEAGGICCRGTANSGDIKISKLSCAAIGKPSDESALAALPCPIYQHDPSIGKRGCDN